MSKKVSGLSADSLKVALKRMICIRRVEELIAQLYLAREIRGFCHLYIGQEAIATALSLVAEDCDDVITSYRAHGFVFLRNDDYEQASVGLVGELMGKGIGCSKGKGGSMHIFDVKHGFYGGHGIVGAQVSLGTGLGFAHKYKNDGGVAFVLMGDGAVNQGQVYESFNMASLWNLPVIYIIENNRYAMGTACERGSATTDLYNRGKSFGISGKQVNAMCLFSVYDALKEAVRACRKNPGSYIIEMMTYRYKGHSMSDPGTYRTRAEVDEYRKNHDPIDNLKNYMTENNVMSIDEIKALEKEMKQMTERVAEVCRASSEPDASELYTDVLNDKQYE